jgi:hypothetical protein
MPIYTLFSIIFFFPRGVITVFLGALKRNLALRSVGISGDLERATRENRRKISGPGGIAKKGGGGPDRVRIGRHLKI